LLSRDAGGTLIAAGLSHFAKVAPSILFFVNFRTVLISGNLISKNLISKNLISKNFP